MILALRWATVMRALVLAAIAGVCVFVFAQGSANSAVIWGERGIALVTVSVLVAALGNNKVFGVVHKITGASHWLFPQLDGKWNARLCSNWPRVERTFNTAKAGGPPFDALTDDLSSADEARRYLDAEVAITCTLFEITMTLRPVKSHRVSRTRFMRPLWNKPALPELSYVFEQEDTDPIASTDEKTHYGAGIIRYDPDTGELAGYYWNNRKEQAGLNTAGSIRMKKVI